MHTVESDLMKIIVGVGVKITIFGEIIGILRVLRMGIDMMILHERSM